MKTLNEFLQQKEKEFLKKCEEFSEKIRILNEQNPKGWQIPCVDEQWNYRWENLILAGSPWLSQ